MRLARLRRRFAADAVANGKQPGAQVDVSGEVPAGQVQLHRIGMAVGRRARLQHVRRLGVVPPGVARQGPREADAAAGHHEWAAGVGPWLGTVV